MNSEELELSLRTEFENYLNGVLTEMREELSQLQEKVAAEIEKHKEQLEVVVQGAISRLPEQKELDAGFRDSVLEHLRLARDEGASITATAIAEAEEMERQNTAAKPGFAELREAINEISGKTTQSEILKSLVNHAEKFAPRGAFFIVKNEHFIGWRTFGAERGETDEAVRDVILPFTSDSILSEATRSLSTVESAAGTFADDSNFLEKLGYGAPEKMYAIPLVVRGRGVALLYADQGTQGAGTLDTDALETMVHVAGLTVDLLASAKTAPKKKSAAVGGEESHPVQETGYQMPAATAPFAPSYQEQPSYQPQTAFQPAYESEPAFQPSYQPEPAVQSFDSYDSAKQESYFPQPTPAESHTEVSEPVVQEESYEVSYDESSWQQPAPVQEIEYTPSFTEEVVPTSEYSTEPVSTGEYSTDFSNQPTVQTEEQPVSEYQHDYQTESASSFETAPSFESQTPQGFESYAQPEIFAPTVEETPATSFETEAQPSSFETERQKESVFSQPAEAVNEAAQPAARARLSDRNVDLPIEVTEEERRLHNDARRFARLLVSEIKLYNEQKVKEGREANDLYERLREAIDRSREMYDKRVQPSVAARFDYFHYELVSSLGEGDVSKLGDSYPGATV